MKKILSIFALIVVVSFSQSCGSNLTVVNNPKRPDPMLIDESAGATIKAAINEALSSDEEQVRLLDFLVKKAYAQEGSTIPSANNTCEIVDDLTLLTSQQGSSGTFGSSSNNVTLNQDEDYCQDSSGKLTIEEGSFTDEVFASFSIGENNFNCLQNEEEFSSFIVRASGVGQYIPPTNNGDQTLVLFGTFLFADPTDTEFELATSLDCRLVLDVNGEVISDESSCSDSDGSVSLSSQGKECSAVSQ
jgi:hypothetical protein